MNRVQQPRTLGVLGAFQQPRDYVHIKQTDGLSDTPLDLKKSLLFMVKKMTDKLTHGVYFSSKTQRFEDQYTHNRMYGRNFRTLLVRRSVRIKMRSFPRTGPSSGAGQCFHPLVIQNVRFRIRGAVPDNTALRRAVPP